VLTNNTIHLFVVRRQLLGGPESGDGVVIEIHQHKFRFESGTTEIDQLALILLELLSVRFQGTRVLIID
jgi:hypothetical protein